MSDAAIPKPAASAQTAEQSAGKPGERPAGGTGRRFRGLAESGEMGLVAYIAAGDPSLDATEKIVLAAAEAGADVIELGVPFSDPVADGPTIQRASDRALRGGTTLAGVLELVKRLRAHTEVPLVIFSYFNPILQMGLERFAAAAAAAFPAWSSLAGPARGGYLFKVADILEARFEQISADMTREELEAVGGVQEDD